MRQTIKLFQIGLRQITKDGMLLVMVPAPFLIGLIFRFALPVVNSITENYLLFSILPWYGLADGILVCIAPMMGSMICAFLLLEERDEGIGEFYQITPVGDYSYLIARIGFPMLWALAETIIVVAFFNLTALSGFTILASSIVSALTGIFLAMLVVANAENRVEGLALSKMSGVSLLGLVAVWFIPHPYRYFTAFLPAFWIGKLITDGGSFFPFVLGILSCLIWIGLFTRKFMRRI